MDYEPEFKREFDTGIIVSIDKTGGGTLGKSYVGTWDFTAVINSQSRSIVGEIETGTAKTHDAAAEAVHDMIVSSESIFDDSL